MTEIDQPPQPTSTERAVVTTVGDGSAIPDEIMKENTVGDADKSEESVVEVPVLADQEKIKERQKFLARLTPEEGVARFQEELGALDETVKNASSAEEARAALIAGEVAAGASPEDARIKTDGVMKKFEEMVNNQLGTHINAVLADMVDGNVHKLLQTFFGTMPQGSEGGASGERNAEKPVGQKEFFDAMSRHGKLNPEYIVKAMKTAYGERGAHVDFDEEELKRAITDPVTLQKVIGDFYINFHEFEDRYDWSKGQKGLGYSMQYDRNIGGAADAKFAPEVLDKFRLIADPANFRRFFPDLRVADDIEKVAGDDSTPTSSVGSDSVVA